MLKIHRFALGVYGFFNGNDVHTYAVASGRHHLSDTCKRNKRHSLKE